MSKLGMIDCPNEVSVIPEVFNPGSRILPEVASFTFET